LIRHDAGGFHRVHRGREGDGDAPDEVADTPVEADAAESGTESAVDGGSGVDSETAGGDPSGDRRDAEFASYDATPAGSDAGLGVVSVSRGLRVAEDAEETSLTAFVTTDNRESVRLGKYLLIPYPDGERLFCRITGLEYAQEFRSDDATEIHARREMRREEFAERDYKFVAELDPMSVVYGDGDEMKRRMTDRVPKPGAVVEEAADNAEIKAGLKIPDDGVFLGHLSVGGETVRTAAEPPHCRLPGERRLRRRRPARLPPHARRRRDRVGKDPRREERAPTVPRLRPHLPDR